MTEHITDSIRRILLAFSYIILIPAIFTLGMILVTNLIPSNIKKEIGNAPIISIMFSSPENRPFGTIDKVYGIHFMNREEAINYCKAITKSKTFDYFAAITFKYPFSSKDFKGSRFEYYIKNCEDLPEHSICIDKNNCLIKYGDE